MNATEIIIALTIHLILPLTGLFYFLRLKKQLKNENIPNPPTTELFIIFSTYGGLLLVVLTTLFWQWSGMASLGAIYLILVAPIVMGIIAYRHRQTKTISKYHYWTYLSGLLYFAIAPVTFGILLLFSKG
jgi:glucose uptake protein GlcU